MKYSYLFLILLACLPLNVLAQDEGRILISGTIVTPIGEAVNDIHVYNSTIHKGALTDDEGNFILLAKQGDELQVTSLPFESFSIEVSPSMIKNKRITIFINQKVNELDEVVLKAYDLSGNVTVDVSKIQTFTDFTNLDLSYETLEFDYAFTPDAQTSQSNNVAKDALLNGQSLEGADLIGGVTLLTKLIFGKQRETDLDANQQQNLMVYNKIKKTYTTDFISTHYNIPQEKVSDFVLFLQEKGVPQKLLQPENELLLLDFMVDASEIYLNKI